MQSSQLKELILQSLHHEKGGVEVYTNAVALAVNPGLKKEWTHYLEETKHHVEVLTGVCGKLGIATDETTPGTQVVDFLGGALVQAMQMAAKNAEPAAAELVAAECVVLAETKDHADWELIGRCALGAEGDVQAALKAAYDEVEDQEDEHLYHTRGWARELWLKSLGLQAVLPPPEEVMKVTTAIGAAKAEAVSMAHRQE